MNNFSKIIVAFIAAAATFAAAAVLIARYADKHERARLHSDVRGKLQIARLRRNKMLGRIEEAVTDAIEDCRGEDCDDDIIMIDVTAPEDSDVDDADRSDDDWDEDFDFDLGDSDI